MVALSGLNSPTLPSNGLSADTVDGTVVYKKDFAGEIFKKGREGIQLGVGYFMFGE